MVDPKPTVGPTLSPSYPTVTGSTPTYPTVSSSLLSIPRWAHHFPRVAPPNSFIPRWNLQLPTLFPLLVHRLSILNEEHFVIVTNFHDSRDQTRRKRSGSDITCRTKLFSTMSNI